MVIITLLFALWSITLIAPDTPIGRFLHRLLIEAPAAWLSRITRGHVLLAAGAGRCQRSARPGSSGGDGLGMLGMAAPEIGSWIAMFEVTTWIDVVAAIALASSVTRVRMVASQIRAILSRWVVRPGRERCGPARNGARYGPLPRMTMTRDLGKDGSHSALASRRSPRLQLMQAGLRRFVPVPRGTRATASPAPPSSPGR